MRTYQVNIAAGTATNPAVTVLDVPCSFLKLMTTTGVANSLQIKATDNANNAVLADNLVMNIGDKSRFNTPADHIEFQNVSGSAIVITVNIGFGDHDQNSIVGNVSIIGGSVSVSNFSGSSISSPADVTITASSSFDVAADTTMRERFIQADSSNTAEVRVRDQSGTTSAGFSITASGHMILGYTGAFRVRNNSAASQIIHLLYGGQ